MSNGKEFWYSKNFLRNLGIFFIILLLGSFVMGFYSHYYEKNNSPQNFVLIIDPYSHHGVITIYNEITIFETIEYDMNIDGDDPSGLSVYLISERLMDIYFDGSYDHRLYIQEYGTQLEYNSDNRRNAAKGIEIYEKSEYRFYFFNDVNCTIEVNFMYKVNHWLSDFSSALMNSATISFGLILPLITIILASMQVIQFYKSRPIGPKIVFSNFKVLHSSTRGDKSKFEVSFAIGNNGDADTIVNITGYSFQTSYKKKPYNDKGEIKPPIEIQLDSGANSEGKFYFSIDKQGKYWDNGTINLTFEYTSEEQSIPAKKEGIKVKPMRLPYTTY